LNTKARSAISRELLCYIRDRKPTELELLAWLGTEQAGRYHVLRKAGLVVLDKKHIVLSPTHYQPEREYFLYEHMGYYLDEDRIDVF
jgi:hypothetical protein